MAELLDWKLDNSGHMELMTLGGYETGNAGELSLLRLEYFATDEATETSAVQLRMLPAHARELADALIKSAEAAETAEPINAPAG